MVDRLNRYLQRPLTLVSAPAGYGKSTLLACWLQTSDIKSAWVSLGKNDNDQRLFLAYVLEAIHSLFPGTVKETQALLGSPHVPPTTILTRSLVNELDMIGQPFVLVLDDYYAIQAKSVHDLIAELLRHAPAPLHLVISTRVDPPLPLARLRARNQLGELRVVDLRFSMEETGKYLEPLIGKATDGLSVARLHEKTEGWVTGMHLLLLTLKQKPDLSRQIEKLLDKNRFVAEYFLDEVVSNQREEIRDYMLATAIPDRFCASLCDALCFPGPRPTECSIKGGEFLRWLEASDLFVIALDEKGRWFRYHNLFRKFLLRQLKKRLGEKDISALYRRTSRWFAENFLIDEALRYALAAGDLLGASQLVEQNRHAPLNEDRASILEKWLSLLPDEIVRRRPELLLAKAWVLNYQFALWAIPPLLEAVETLPKDESTKLPQGEIDLFNGIFSFWEGRGERAMALLQRALERTPEKNIGVRNEIVMYLAGSRQIAGQGRTAIREYRRRFCNEVSEGPYKLRLLAAISFIHLLSGELREAQEAIRQVSDMATRTDNVYVAAWSEYMLGIIHFQWNNLSTASQHFIKALKNRFWLDAGVDADSYAGLILSYHGMRQFGKADKTMDQMIAFAQETGSIDRLARTRSLRARLGLLQGDVESAARYLETTDLSNDEGTMLFWLDVPRITQCRVMAARQSEADLSEATEKLRKLLRFCLATHNTPQTIEILLLQAAVCQKQGQIGQAMTALEHAATLARPGGYIRPFVNHGANMADLLTRLLQCGKAANYIEQILGAFDAYEPVDSRDESFTRHEPHPWERNQALENPLTNRELEVLSLLGQGLRNKEVADRLFVSLETVKKHAVNIYRKLDVRNRQQAVVKAYEQGILMKNT